MTSSRCVPAVNPPLGSAYFILIYDYIYDHYYIIINVHNITYDSKPHAVHKSGFLAINPVFFLSLCIECNVKVNVVVVHTMDR